MVQQYVAGILVQTKYQLPASQLSTRSRRVSPEPTELTAVGEFTQGFVFRQRGISAVAQAQMGWRVIVDAIQDHLGQDIRAVAVLRGSSRSISHPHAPPVGSSAACRGCV